MGDSEQPPEQREPRVHLPEENVPEGAIRAVLEALAQTNGLTAFAVRLLTFIDPPERERLLAEWQAEVTNAVNDHDEAIRRLEAKITPRLRVGKLAVAVAHWLTQESEDALRDPVMFDDLVAAFPGVSKSVLEEACFELKYLDLVTCTDAMGSPIRAVRPQYDLFWSFDPIVHKTNPQTDAVELAKLVLEDSKLESIHLLDERASWPRRRLNPAIAYLMQFVDDRRVSKEAQNEYPTRFFALTSEDRFKLRRFVEEAGA